MDLSFFTTQQTASGSGANGASKLSASGFTDLGLFFQNFLQGGLLSPQTQTTSVKNTAQEKTPLLATNQDINATAEALEFVLAHLNGADNSLDNVLAFDPSAADGASEISISIGADGTVSLNLSENAHIALKSLLQGSLLIGKPEKSSVSPFANTEATLDDAALFQQILKNIDQSAGIKISPESLIATGLTPQNISNALNLASVHLTKSSSAQEMPEELIALLGLTHALPAQSILTKAGLSLTLSNGGAWSEKNELPATGKKPLSAEALLKTGPDQATLAQIASSQQGSKATQMMAGAANENTPLITSHFSSFVDMDGGFNLLDASLPPFSNTAAFSPTLTQAGLTSLVTQSPAAHAAHPATQMIAASLQKNTNGGTERQNWTLQLDPPDLGKVEIRLSFTKEKMMKAQMIVEKPETWLMLQRDAQALERALTQNGLEFGEGDMSFELASDQHDFSQNGSHDQNQQGGSSGSEEADGISLIETTMSWFVDENSGLQRYNLMV